MLPAAFARNRVDQMKPVAIAAYLPILLALFASLASAQIAFAPPANYDTGNPMPSSAGTNLAVADFNRDGRMDVAVGTLEGVTVFVNQGGGSLLLKASYVVSASASVVAQDFNGDGSPDLATLGSQSGSFAILISKRDGTFNPPVYYGSGSLHFGISLVAGAFFGDGRNHVGVLNAFNFGSQTRVSLFRNNGSGAFSFAGDVPMESNSRLTMADVNNDGALDFITTGGARISITLNDGAGRFVLASEYPNISTNGPVAVADVNFDASPDLLLPGTPGGSVVQVMLNRGDGFFSAPVYYNAGDFQVQRVWGADFDGDCLTDIVVSGAGSNGVGKLSVLRNNGNGTFAAPIIFYSTTPPSRYYLPILCADMNGDGPPDLITAEERAGSQPVTSIHVFINISEQLPMTPRLDRIVPDRGGNAGIVTARIFGKGLLPGATVKLTADGQPDIIGISPTVVAVQNVAYIQTAFDLRGAATGLRNVVVTQPDNSVVTLNNKFALELGSKPEIWVDIIGRSAIRPDRQQTYLVMFGNRGNMDVAGIPLWVGGVPSDASMELGTQISPTPTLEGQDPIDRSEVPVIMTSGGQKVAPLYIPLIPAGITGSLYVTVTIPAGRQFELQAWANPPYFEFIPIAQNNSLSASWEKKENRLNVVSAYAQSAASPISKDALDCAKAIGLAAFEELLGIGLGESCKDLLRELDIALLNQLLELNYQKWVRGELAKPAAHSSLEMGYQTLIAVAKCAGYHLTPAGKLRMLYTFTEKFEKAMLLLELANECFHTASRIAAKVFPVAIVASRDPNDKVGSLGVSLPRYLSGAEFSRYTVFFENVETATAPAQEVLITDQLDVSKFDLSTFSLGPIAFGDRFVTPPSSLSGFTTDVDLRPSKNLIVRINAELDKSTGIITWRFTSIDPATGLPTDDPLAGFLPPNRMPPEGDGSVSFTIMPKQGLATGTEIRNQARIVFDVNPPIDTPQWLNTLDNTKPVSSVGALAAIQTAASFLVNWAGMDQGAGVKDYTIFVAENGGPYAPWLTNTSATEATFAGRSGNSYAFYSVARDQVGNVESAKSVAEASTQVIDPDADLAITQTVTPNPVMTGSNLTYTITVTNNGPGTASSVTVTDNLPASMSFVSCAASNGGVCDGTGNNRTVNFVSLAPGASANMTIVAKVDCVLADGTAISNTAAVSSSTTDPNPANNSAVANTIAFNPPPTITAPPTVVAMTGPGATTCGTVISDAVLGIAVANDNCPGVTITRSGVPAGNLFPVGTTTITYTATDAAGNTATATQTVIVNDDTPPTITGISADPSMLWPPHHQMIEVTVNYAAMDNCTQASGLNCSLSVTSDEPINGTGDGDTFPDWEILDAHRVRLRAERAGNGNGRIYTITITCTDEAGNSSSKSVTVRVPKNNG